MDDDTGCAVASIPADVAGTAAADRAFGAADHRDIARAHDADLGALVTRVETSPEPQTEMVASANSAPSLLMSPDPDVSIARFGRGLARSRYRPNRMSRLDGFGLHDSNATSPDPLKAASQLVPENSPTCASPEPLMVSMNSALSTASIDRSPDPISVASNPSPRILSTEISPEPARRQLERLHFDRVDRQIARTGDRAFEVVAADLVDRDVARSDHPRPRSAGNVIDMLMSLPSRHRSR